jgi:hypothetical protein
MSGKNFKHIVYFISLLLYSFNNAYSQSVSGISSITPAIPQINVPTPQVYQFRDISATTIKLNNQPTISTNYFPVINNVITSPDKQIEQYERDLQAVTQSEQQKRNIQSDLRQEEFYKKNIAHLEETRLYQNTFNVFKQLNPDSFSITDAIFLVENAYSDNKLPYDRFVNALKQRAELVQQILKREKINSKNNLALNYGIQKLFSQSNNYYFAKTKQTITVQPVKYDFEDFKGEKDYKKMFVSKLLMTGKGQCHSMPLFYLAIAEQLGAKAYLSLAPQHSFIQFFDAKNNRLSFETTNGNLVSQNWILQSGFVNAAALKNKTYVDTLSQRRLFAQCMGDLLLGYEHKFGHDDFAEQMRQYILEIDPVNLTAKITEAQVKTQAALNAIYSAGKPLLKDLSKYPAAYTAYQQMLASYKDIDDLGYQDMPNDAYQAWRKSIEFEKKKLETKELKERMKLQIEFLKMINTKPTLIRSPKG